MRPLATYRFQVHADFPFDSVRRAAAHVKRLGASHAHLSPITAARPGSTHGYDVVDPSRLSDDLGGDAGFDALSRELHDRGLGLVLDVVPNHECASPLNARWQDVLRHGAASEHAARYDVDWERGKGRVLRPILDKSFGEALENGELSLRAERDEIVLRAGDTPLPLDPRTWPLALGESVRDDPPEIARALRDLCAVAAELPSREDRTTSALASRRETSAELRSRLASLLADDSVRARIESRLGRLSGRPGEPRSFDALEALCRAQAWRLTAWTAASEDVNYRRFFDITDLVGVRVEDEAIFEATHALVLDLAANGDVQGLRVDHVDGLREPRAYLERLGARLRDATGGRGFIVVEKILAASEDLPADWPVYGTTGYETLNAITGALVDPAGLQALQASYASRTGRERTLLQSCFRRKAQAMKELLDGDERRLVALALDLARADRHACDVTGNDVRAMLEALTAALRVYRTYREPHRDPSDADVAVVAQALEDASRIARTAPRRRALSFLARLILGPLPDATSLESRFVLRWQQFTAPAMAKGLEDTAFYVHVPLLATNEVGGDLGGGAAFAGAEAFHARARRQLEALRPGFAPTSTHDTKRGEDARARLAVLSEMPERWSELVETWRAHEPPLQRIVHGLAVPDANERELLLQSLLGCWPLPREAGWKEALLERFDGFVVKAAREAKTHSSWQAPDEAHESALTSYVHEALRDETREPFASFAAFADEVAEAGFVGSLAQCVLRATLPATPEIYAGSESWNLSLVDPDNRRPVDLERLDRELASIERAEDRGSLARDLVAQWTDGRAKLLVTWAALQARARDEELFAEGEHVPLAIERASENERPARVLAFARRLRDRVALVVVPLTTTRDAFRELRALPAAWSGVVVALPKDAPSRYRDALTGRELTVRAGLLDASEAWRDLPVSLLVSE